MIITSAKWHDEAQTSVAVTTSDNCDCVVRYFATYNSNETYHMSVLREWLGGGGTISAWTDSTDYMALMRSERDRLIADIYWRVERNQTQVAGSITPSDDSTKMTAIYTYLQDLRDMPEDNPNVTTKAQYDALVWPTKPA